MIAEIAFINERETTGQKSEDERTLTCIGHALFPRDFSEHKKRPFQKN